MSFRIDSELVKRRIGEVLTKIEVEADPQKLTEYRSIFKREVSFFRRSYVAAYLLMQMDQGKIPGGGDFRSRRSRGSAKSGSFSRPEESSPVEQKVYPLSDEDSVRLFFSAGRSRRVFPREILGLINAKTSISKDDIGAIRILDNYSFVQVRNTVADTIIEALNGKTFRGRILSVNYARNRKDESSDAAPDAPGLSPEDDPVPEEAVSPERDDIERDDIEGDDIKEEKADDHTDEKDI